MYKSRISGVLATRCSIVRSVMMSDFFSPLTMSAPDSGSIYSLETMAPSFVGCSPSFSTIISFLLRKVRHSSITSVRLSGSCWCAKKVAPRKSNTPSLVVANPFAMMDNTCVRSAFSVPSLDHMSSGSASM